MTAFSMIYFIYPDIRSDSTQRLNVNAPEFTVNPKPMGFFPMSAKFLQHSKSSGNIHHQFQLAVARHQAEQLTKPRIAGAPFMQLPNLSMANSPNEGQINVSKTLLFCVQNSSSNPTFPLSALHRR